MTPPRRVVIDPDRIMVVGDTGLLVELDELPAVLALAAAVRAAPPPGLIDVVPGARTVLLTLTAGTDLGVTRRELLASIPTAPRATPRPRRPSRSR